MRVATQFLGMISQQPAATKTEFIMSAAPKDNARLVPRMPGVTIGPLHLTAASAVSFSAEVHDISIIGVGLIGELACPAGSYFIVEGGPQGRILTKALTAELRHATQRADGRWLLGCSFSRHLTTDDVEILG